MKLKKHLKRALCIMLAVCLLVISPVSKYFDTQRIETVEGASVAIPFLSGIGLLYILSQTLGYDIGSVDAVNVRNGLIDFIETLDTVNDEVKQRTTSLFLTERFDETVELAGTGNQVVSIVEDYLETKIYNDASDFNETLGITGIKVSPIWDVDSVYGVGYDRLPTSYKTALMSEQVDYFANHWQYPRTDYFAVYSQTEDCYYMATYNSSDQHPDSAWSSYVIFEDGVYLVGFDDSDYINNISAVNFDKFEYTNEYGMSIYDTVLGNSSLIGNLIYDDFQIASNLCIMPPLTITKSQWDNLYYSDKDLSLLENYVSDSYFYPAQTYSVINHGIRNVDFVDKLTNIFALRTARLAELANVYDVVLTDSYTMGLTDYLPNTRQDELERKVVADVYPVTDTVIDDAITDTGTDDGNTDTGDDTVTGEGTDTDTGTDTAGFWATLWDWLKKIYNVLYYSWTSYKNVEATVISGLPDLTETATNIKEGVRDLVADVAHIGEYDIDIWDVLSDIDRILTNGAIANVGTYLADIYDQVITVAGDNASVLDVLTLGISEVLSDILDGVLSIPQTLVDLLAELLRALFIPDTDTLANQIAEFEIKFSWVGAIFDFVDGIREVLSSDEPPVIYIHFEDSESKKYQSVGTQVIFDASWYAPYKPYGDAILSAFIYAVFLWRLFKRIPSIISGAGMITEEHIKFDDKMSK